MAKRKQKSGSAKMSASGKLPIMLGVTADQKEVLKAAAWMQGRSVANFCVINASIAAIKQLRKEASEHNLTSLAYAIRLNSEKVAK